MDTFVPVLDHLSVLADPTRARMLCVLEGRELTVSELCDVIQLPQSTASRHLRILADAGWVTSRRDGTRRLYSLVPEDLDGGTRRLWGLVRDQIGKTSAAGQDGHRLKRVLALRRSGSEEFFSSAAGQWSRLRAELFGEASHLRALLGLLDERWVVGDLGCGTGEVAELIAPFVARVIAVDGSREMLEAARARLADHPNAAVRPGPLERLPVEGGELDVALLVLVLHHVADPAAVLTEAARVVRPGGRLLIADMLPHDHDEYRRTMGHVWLGFAERQMARHVSSAGFEAFRWRPLAAAPRAKGPTLFVATATRALAAATGLARSAGRRDLDPDHLRGLASAREKQGVNG
jgi:SAM-dependent methyltransferase